MRASPSTTAADIKEVPQYSGVLHCLPVWPPGPVRPPVNEEDHQIRKCLCCCNCLAESCSWKGGRVHKPDARNLICGCPVCIVVGHGQEGDLQAAVLDNGRLDGICLQP